MIGFDKIRYRLSSMSIKGLKESSIMSIDMIRKIALKNHRIDMLKNYMEGWKTIYKDENHSFDYLLETINEYFNDYNNKNELSIIVREMNNNIIPSLKDINSNLESIAEFSLKYDKSILETAKICKVYDRVINNHRILNKKGFDDYIYENYICNDNISLIETVNGLCDKINSYKMKPVTKINVALENILYGIDKQYGKDGYNKQLLVESIYDNCLTYGFDKTIVNNVLSENNFYSDEEKDSVLKINEDYVYLEGKKIDKPSVVKFLGQLKSVPKSTPFKKVKDVFNSGLEKVYGKSKDNIIDDTPNILSWIRNFYVFSTFTIPPLGLVTLFTDKFLEKKFSRKRTEKMIKDLENQKKVNESQMNRCKNPTAKAKHEAFDKELEKNLEKINDYADTLYTEKENDKRHGYDEASGEFSIANDMNNKYLSIDEYFKDYHIKVYKELIKLQQAISKFKVRYLKPMDRKAIDDFKECDKKDFYKYLDGDSRIVINLADYFSMYEKIGLMKKYNNRHKCEKIIRNKLITICNKLDYVSDDFTILFDGDDEIVHIYAIVNLIVIDTIQERFDMTMENDIKRQLVLTENMCYANDNNFETVLENNIDSLSIDDLEEINKYIFNTNLIDYKKLEEIYSDYKEELLNSKDKSRMYLVEETICELKKYKKEIKPISYLEDFQNYNLVTNAILEGKIKNHLKVINSRIGNKAKNLSTKEKLISDKMDRFIDGFYDKAERRLSNKNRERVIKGTILPSFSTLMKMFLASNLVGLLNPVLGVITFVGGLAISRKATKKEKQYILDEIEIQLKVVNEKISLAKSNNDMKSLEILYRTQKKLSQEKQRIIYDGKARNYVPDIKD